MAVKGDIFVLLTQFSSLKLDKRTWKPHKEAFRQGLGNIHRSACEEALYKGDSSILLGYREYKEDCLSEMHPLRRPLPHEQHRLLYGRKSEAL